MDNTGKFYLQTDSTYLDICMIARNHFCHASLLFLLAEWPTSDEDGNVLFVLLSGARIPCPQVSLPCFVGRHDELFTVVGLLFL